jgi:hypothetical protein
MFNSAPRSLTGHLHLARVLQAVDPVVGLPALKDLALKAVVAVYRVPFDREVHRAANEVVEVCSYHLPI